MTGRQKVSALNFNMGRLVAAEAEVSKVSDR